MNLYNSFDIFDTLLTRTVLNPKDVFTMVQAQISGKLPDVPRRFHFSFKGMRIWSEFVARRKALTEDIPLAEIYRTLMNAYGLDNSQVQRLINLELSVERELLVPVNGACALVDSCRSLNHRIVFVSDMYLPSGFIQNILECHELFLPGDRIYVSGELGVTKGSGNLFKYMLDDMNVSRKDIIHYGDNLRSDYFIPKSLGIRILNEPVGRSSGSLAAGFYANLTYFRELLSARLQIFGARNV